jgi:hypothetical protein
LGAKIPIYGVPINFDLSYDDVRKISSQLQRIRNISYSTEHYLAIYSSIWSDKSLAAYQACVGSDVSTVGTFLRKSRDAATSKKFSVYVRWLAGVGGATGKFDFVGQSPFVVRGVKVVGPYAKHPPRTIVHGQEIPVEIERDLSEAFEFTTSINHNLARRELHLPAYTPPQIDFVVRQTDVARAHSDFGQNGNDGADDTQFRPPNDTLLAGNNEEFLVPTARIFGHTSGDFGGQVIDLKEPKRIRWYVEAYTNSKAHGAYAEGYLSVIAAVVRSGEKSLPKSVEPPKWQSLWSEGLLPPSRGGAPISRTVKGHSEIARPSWVAVGHPRAHGVIAAAEVL